MRRGRLKKKKKNGTQASTPPFAFQLFTTHLSGNSNAKIAAIASSRFFSLGPPDLVGMTALRNEAAGACEENTVSAELAARCRRQSWQ